MSIYRVVLSLNAVLLIVHCFNSTFALAQKTTSASMFAPNTISNGEVFGTTFSPDGKTVYFCRSSKDRKTIVLMQSTLKKGIWSAPVAMPFSGSYRDIDPFVSHDGKRLYFNSMRPLKTSDTTPTLGFHIWYCTWQSGVWSPPVLMPAPVTSDTASEYFATVTRTGDVYFAYNAPNNPDAAGVYVSTLNNKMYQPPKRITAGSVKEMGNPYIAPDSRYMIFVSGKPTSQTDSDLFITFRQKHGWSEPIRLNTSVNTEFAEFAPNVHDGKLYFTRMKRGKEIPIAEENIYVIRLKDLNIKGL